MPHASLLDWVRTGFTSRGTGRRGPSKGPAVADRRRRSRLLLEALEGRVLLATIPVNSTVDQLFQATDATISVLKHKGAKISLRDAINIANNSPGADTIVLQRYQTYKLDKIDNYWYGADGLPAISSPITINGGGATIGRDGGGPAFRFFYVSDHRYGGLADGSLTLQYLTLQGGLAKGGNSYGGGGGLGAGGAIFNQGTLELDNVLLANNTALGGSTFDIGIGETVIAGAGIGQDAPDSTASPQGGGFGGALPGSINFSNGGPSREGQGAGIAGGTGQAGFGGGGGALVPYLGGLDRDGGFGAGGGGGFSAIAKPGLGGFGAGDGADADSNRGGAGAGLGGAIFNRGGTVAIVNSTLTQNEAHGGDGGTNFHGPISGSGSGFGGAIFNLNGTTRLIQDTIAGNNLDGGSGFGGRSDGYQVYNLADSLDGRRVAATLSLVNTILAGAPSYGHDLINQTFANAPNNQASVTSNDKDVNPQANIISTSIPNYDGNFVDGTGGSRGVVDVSFKQVDPQLSGLNNNGGRSRTMSLGRNSPARSAGLLSQAFDAQGRRLIYDQRGPGYLRTPGSSIDIGAFQSIGGPGGGRFPVAKPSATIRVGPSASGEALRILGGGYKLHRSPTGIASVTGPMVVGVADLANAVIDAELVATYKAGQTVGLTRATRADAARLGTLLGQVNPAGWSANVPRADLVAFRKVAVGGAFRSETTIELPLQAAPLPRGVRPAAARRQSDQQLLGWLTPVFAVVPPAASPAPAESPADPPNLAKVADSVMSTLIEGNMIGDSVKVTNTTIGARSFSNANAADFFYVSQAITQFVAQRPNNDLHKAVNDTITYLTGPNTIPLISNQSPESTLAQTSSTTTMGFSLGGTAGWAEGQGLNASLNIGFTYTNSTTTTYPPVDITNMTNPLTGIARWTEGLHNPSSGGGFSYNYYNNWIWEIPFTAYGKSQTGIVFSTDSSLSTGDSQTPPVVELHLDSTAPLPFDAFTLSKPVLTSVSTPIVREGSSFLVNGTGLYPSLVTSVLVGGEALPAANFVPMSDTQLLIIAPKSSGKDEPVVVNVSGRVSNDNIKVTIVPTS